jgi:hypothetical protein
MLRFITSKITQTAKQAEYVLSFPPTIKSNLVAEIEQIEYKIHSNVFCAQTIYYTGFPWMYNGTNDAISSIIDGMKDENR